MKIGILTLPLTENYGGILQAVALYNFLEARGHEVVLIQKPGSAAPQGLISALKAAVRWFLLRVPFHDFKNTKAIRAKKRGFSKRKAFHRPFIEKAIKRISGDLRTTAEMAAFAEKEQFDAIIVGSDQVWRKQYINGPYYQNYFLDFVDGKTCKKIAYAASFGKDHWEGIGDAERIGQLLSDFTAISTRETSGLRICRETFGYSGGTSLLDPTLIVDRNFYVTHVIGKHLDGEFNATGLLTYVLDEEPEKADIIRRAMDSTGSGNITHLKGFNKSSRTYSVPEWLASFYHADFVVTDSFHGMAFSIIFEKNFIAIGNKGRGLERFTSLLSQLDLSDRLVLNKNDLSQELFKPIDYTRIEESLLPLKKKAITFLLKALNGENS